MRVIAGSARRLQLKTLDGMDTRPTTDRIKETLFNIIQDEVPGAYFLDLFAGSGQMGLEAVSRGARYDCMFLDLFAGSGGIGIEALSRGAMGAVFVEKNPKAMSCIRDNLKTTNLMKKAITMSTDVMTALYKLEGDKQFDYIFMDPPYHQELERKVLEYLSGSNLLSEEGVIIVEAAKETTFDYLQDLGFTIIKTKEYKTNKHVFIEPSGRKEVC